jgi:hypothetical protein
METATDVPPFLCEHSLDSARARAHRVVCGVCGSFWDVESRAARVTYDASYPEKRGHFDPRVGALKVRTLDRWLRASGVKIDGRRVCEVGFGGGSCLALLAGRAARVLGLEVNQSAIDQVRATGVAADFLLVDQLPATLDAPIDLWLFQDAYEHIPNPAPFVDWMRANSSDGAEILMVLPRGDSLSQRTMGRMWLHKLPDHEFHWSRRGLIEFMGRRGFALAREFSPLKFVSPQMALAHALHKIGAPSGTGRAFAPGGWAVPFNFGEMGLVFARR